MVASQHFQEQKWKIYPQSILNGVLGDYLVSRDNPLSLPMSLFELNSSNPLIVDGKMEQEELPLDLYKSRAICLFIHGAADNELCWYRTGKKNTVNFAEKILEDFGYYPLFLRYNSGLGIEDNGTKLSNLLHVLVEQVKDHEIDIHVIAHSMGGLIFRGALAEGCHKAEPWTKSFKEIFYLGSPHYGAPLEDFGKFTTGLLNVLPYPYTRLVAKIINLRSEGIQNLGSNDKSLEHDKKIDKSINEYFIAATIFNNQNNFFAKHFGDIMVPLKSAKKSLEDDHDNVHIITKTSHPKLPVSIKAYNIIQNILKKNNE